MKNKIIYIATLLILSLSFGSCSDFLDRMPSNELEEEQVWESFENARDFHYDTYNFLRNGRSRINSSWLDAATDLAHTSYSRGVRTSMNIGNYYAASGASELTATWEHYYRGIRKCNKFLENIDDVPLLDESQKARKANYIAESRFLRAYFYWELILRYGGVPIITESIDPSSDEILNRATEKESLEFVWNELNALKDADQVLDGFVLRTDSDVQANEDHGTITRGANLALLSRVSLFLASPRYAEYDLVDWNTALGLSELSLSTLNEIYSLYQKDENFETEYHSAILERSYAGNPEPIFWRNDGQSNWLPAESPIGFGGQGGLCPSQNLIDMYDMANGQSPFVNYDATGAPVYDVNGMPTINELSGYDDNHPYENRDPRLNQTVLHHGSTWWNRPIDVIEGGADNPRGNANSTKTGYYNKKYMDDRGTDYLQPGLNIYRNWIFIRYAELLLNYAEAFNEVNGPSNEVFGALQQLRNRVGMTALLSERSDLQSQEALRNFIHKERTIELAFEEHRMWDVKRWNVAEEALSRPIYGVEVTTEGDQTVYSRKLVQQRVFEKHMYLYPIPQEEIWKTGWDNNEGW
nr:RagB/SusD family nutrient uptake outer membrane protein [uncultured Carboxylicivirga sp.]